MGSKTNIEWTDATWNPTRGCSRVSAGCVNCYAETFAATRLSGPGQAYEGLATMVNGHPRWTNTVRLVPKKLGEPLKWRSPKRVFVDSMSDLFHEQVPFAYVARVFAVMAITAREHTFQILTKRPERMRAFMIADETERQIEEAMAEWTHNLDFDWPPPNVWLGVSVEDQATADSRIPVLLQTPAAVRFISLEPQLADVDLEEYLYPRFAADDPRYYRPVGRGLDWIIQGGESGPARRSFDKEWARHTRDQCQAMGVAYFFKQAGGSRPAMDRELDGRTWDEFPIVREAVTI